MTRIIIALIISMASTIMVFAQKSEERNLKPFDKVRVNSEVKVFLSKGDKEQARVVASGIELTDVITRIDGKTLNIELSRGVFYGINVDLFVTYRELRDIYVTGSGSVSVEDTITGDKVVLVATTNGQIQADLDLRTADIEVGQGSTIRLKGKIGSYEAKISAKGILSALDLQADSTFVKVASASTAKVFARELLDANVRTGGTLTYAGSPRNKKIKTGIATTVNEIEE